MTRRLAIVTPLAIVAIGCNMIVGSYDLREDALLVDGGGNDTGTSDRPDGETDTPDAENCNVDLANQCYPCEPTTNEQLLNACTDNTCIPFDRSRLTSLLLADGGLPPISDGGTQ